ncbi:MAG: anti-sigma F factor [Erysipelotrichales bacterium]|nr:anti-sigma F factor [Erysipelotrichales bacterium]
MNQMEVSFSATLDNENFARTAVASFLTPLNPTVDEIIELKTIVSEGVSNAIIHGYNHNKECHVVLKMSVEGRNVELIIQDYGKGIENLEQVKTPFYTTKKDLEHAGMGLTIIETLADHLKVESVINIGTKLIITKKLKDNGTV